MSDLSFEWDAPKAAANLEKHGVSFEQARTVFWDEAALLLADEDHFGDEDRFYILGLSQDALELVVTHCYRVEDEVIRIISARRADKSEQRAYWEARTK